MITCKVPPPRDLWPGGQRGRYPISHDSSNDILSVPCGLSGEAPPMAPGEGEQRGGQPSSPVASPTTSGPRSDQGAQWMYKQILARNKLYTVEEITNERGGAERPSARGGPKVCTSAGSPAGRVPPPSPPHSVSHAALPGALVPPPEPACSLGLLQRHWLYHSLVTLQVEPAAQVVGPV